MTALREVVDMNANVGMIDRGLRIGAGLGLVAWAALGGPVWAWVGVVPLATGAFAFCPLYRVFGFSSCPVRKG